MTQTQIQNRYFMEDPREKQRLAEKVDANQWVQETLSPFLQGDEQVLDVGCGPAALVKAVAERFPNARVHGLDASDDRFDAARNNLTELSNAAVYQGDALSLPFEDNQFDVVYSRFMLEYLPDPGRAIREMARVCRPGGRILVQDLDGQLLWHDGMPDSVFQQVQIVVEHLQKSGFDPYIGRKLFGMCRRAGLTDITTNVAAYHCYAGKIDDQNERLWRMKLDIAFPQIAVALGSEVKAHELVDAFMTHLADEETFTYSNIITVTGHVGEV